jgi:4-hydroxy-4-methyl-2-oxoglutarate aldolase
MMVSIADLLQYGTATIFEAYPGAKALPGEIAPLWRPIQLCGPAFPVYAPPGDNLAAHLALAEAPEGCVLVVYTGGEKRKGFWGEVMTEAATARRVSGLVTDGAVRDIKAIRDLGFPVFSAGIAIPGTVKLQEGTRNSQIELSGVPVAPGDIVFGDDDGVVLVPKDLLEAVGQSAEKRMRKEAEFIRQLKQGALTVDLLGLRK